MLTLTFLGSPRTATWSTWHVFKSHKQVSCSVQKEPFNNSSKKWLFPIKKELYFSYFDITKDTKVLLDATPSVYYYLNNLIKKMDFVNKKIIYVLRDPYERLYSTVKQTIITYNRVPWKSNRYPRFIKGKLKIEPKEIVTHFIPISLDHVHLEHAFSITNDVFITKIEDIISDLNPICDFLEIDHINRKLPHKNKMEHWYSDPYWNGVKEKVDLAFKKYRKEIDELIDKDTRILNERYGIVR